MALLAAPAIARAATITVTEAGSSKLQYDAYRLIDGDVSTASDGTPSILVGTIVSAFKDALVTTLGDAGYDPGIELGDSSAAQSSKVIAALNRAAAVNPGTATGTSIQQIAHALALALAADGVAPTVTAVPDASGTLKFSGLPTGYYLVTTNDQSLSQFAPADSQIAATALLIALPSTGASSTVKGRVPSVSKQVGEVDESGNIDWNKIADAQMLEWTPYRITGTLPSNWDEFKTYFYEFTDRRDDALELDRASVKIELVDAKGNAVQDLTGSFTVKDENQTLTAICADLKDAASKATASHAVRLTYNARLIPGKAAIGTKDPADNYVYLTYTRAPGVDGRGRTPEDRARLLTWAIDLTKLDGAALDAKRLAGAAFTLQDHQGRYVQTDGHAADAPYEFVTNDQGEARVPGLDAGTYTLTEVRAPEGYARIENPIAITITHELDEQAARLGAKLDHSAVTVARVDVAAGTVELIIENTEPGIPGNDTGKHKTPGWIPQTGDAAMGITLALAAAGTLFIVVALRTRRRAGCDDDAARLDHPTR